MGDDRHGRSPRPGGRAPWERYSTADYTERDVARAPRRARHADSAESAPLTVQDLVQRVDDERSGRKHRATAPPEAGPTTRATPQQSGRPDAQPRQAAQPATPRATGEVHAARRTGSSPVVDDIAGVRAPTVSRPATSWRPTAEVSRQMAPGPRAGLDPPEVVTDVIEPVAEPARAKRTSSSWPTTESAALPKSVGMSRPVTAKQRRNQRLRIAGRTTMAACAVLALIATGIGWGYLRSTDNSFTQVSALDDNPEDVLDSNLQLGDENYLIVGTDTRAGANGGLGAGTLDDAEGSRADTVMLVNIPKNRSRVVVVSFPRDLDVTRPQCEGWDNDKATYTGENFSSAMGDKLNAVYALGGPRCLVNVIRKMTGLSIGHFIGIDFAGFEAMVDQIGGVEVCSTKPIIDGVLGTVLETSGRQRVNGETALNYVRARHVYGEERSDYDRINRQQRFLASLLRGALSSKVLLDPGKMNGFVTAFTSHTWVDNVKVPDLLMLGRSLQKMDAGAVTFLTIPTAGTTSYGNEIPRESDIKAIFRAVIDDQPLPGEKKAPEAGTSSPTPPPAPPKLIAVDPSAVSVLVSNGSGVSGVANKAATKLGNQGFRIYSTGNYSGGTSTTSKIRYASGHEAEAATVASSIPGSSLEPAEELGSIVEVVLGSDFTGTVRPPTDVGDPLPSVPIGMPASAASVTLPSDLEHMNAADETCK